MFRDHRDLCDLDIIEAVGTHVHKDSKFVPIHLLLVKTQVYFQSFNLGY